jgi:SAM-dependent methyltransferase
LAAPLTLAGALRYDLVGRTIAELPGVRSILEIGMGIGAVGARLARTYEYVGLDADAESAAIARQRIEQTATGGAVIHGTTADLNPNDRFDLVCAFEVLEHIEDDEGALREWRNLIRPDGWLVISVPAWRRRYGAHDKVAGHFRRYERSDLLRISSGVGFKDQRVLAWGFPLGNLLEAMWHGVAARTDKGDSFVEKTARSGRRFQPHPVLGWATQTMTLPFALVQRRFVATDLGIGLILVARRAEEGDAQRGA